MVSLEDADAAEARCPGNFTGRGIRRASTTGVRKQRVGWATARPERESDSIRLTIEAPRGTRRSVGDIARSGTAPKGAQEMRTAAAPSNARSNMRVTCERSKSTRDRENEVTTFLTQSTQSAEIPLEPYSADSAVAALNVDCLHRSLSYFAEQGVGFQPLASGCFLNCEVLTHGCCRYVGSSNIVVTVR